MTYSEPEKIQSSDSECLSGKRYAYQEDLALVEDVYLDAATPGADINWLEDIELLSEDFLSDHSWRVMRGRKRVLAFTLVVVGAFSMSLVGAWA